MAGMLSRNVRHSRGNRSESAILDQQYVDMSKRIQKSRLWNFHVPLQRQIQSNAFCHLVLSTWRLSFPGTLTSGP